MMLKDLPKVSRVYYLNKFYTSMALRFLLTLITEAFLFVDRIILDKEVQKKRESRMNNNFIIIFIS